MRIENVSKSFDGVPVLRGVSHAFPLGVAAITGPSGCGKTTLLRIVAGLEKPDEGTVVGAGRVSFVFQEDRLIGHYSLYRNLRLVCRDDDKIQTALRAAGLWENAKKRANLLSGGMRRRAAFLRGALFEADTLLLDEPFNGVDPARRDELAGWLKREWRGRRVIAVSHEPDDLVRLGAEDELRLGE